MSKTALFVRQQAKRIHTMNSLLIINASARTTRSITRNLTDRFAAVWRRHHPAGEVIDRDVGAHSVPPISQNWIAAALADHGRHTPAMRAALAISDELIDELFRATAIVVGVPMYNFGMPAQPKAYVDQVIRVGRTFTFNDAAAASPYQPLIPAKPLVIVTAKGAGGYEPDGHSAHLNFLEPHLETVFPFIGLSDISMVRVAFEEKRDERFQQSLTDAERTIDQLAERIAGRPSASQSTAVAHAALA